MVPSSYVRIEAQRPKQTQKNSVLLLCFFCSESCSYGVIGREVAVLMEIVVGVMETDTHKQSFLEV